MEEYEMAKARGAKIYAEVSGYGMSGDAHHISGPSEDGDGPMRVMKAALDDADWTNLSVVVVQQRAQAEVEMGGYLAAAGIVNDAMTRLGRIQPLLQTYEAYMHNAFAQLYNAKKIANAKAVIDQGIAAYPESKMFQQDLELLKKAQRQ